MIQTTFSEKDAAEIMEVKFSIAKFIATHFPLVLIDKFYGNTSSWCVAGGWFHSAYHGQEKDADVDVFIFRGQKNLIEPFTKSKFFEMTMRAGYPMETIQYIFADHQASPKIQYIFLREDRRYRSPSDVVDEFDLVHCQPYYFENKLYISKFQFDCIVNKRLETTKEPKKSRIDKWVARGYSSL